MNIYHQSVFKSWPLEDKSVQAIITSPPYWQLRKYDIPDVFIGGKKDCRHELGEIIHKKDTRGIEGSGLEGRDPYKEGEARLNYKYSTCRLCNSWKGQYGLEPSFELFLEHTFLWCEEARRVLKDDGLFFMNLGDKYLKHTVLKIPDRIAIELIDNGWYLRNDIIWNKTNGIPGSMKNRFINRHEKIFMFSKKPTYYFDLDAVREPYKPSSLGRLERSYTKSGVPEGSMPDGRALKCRSYKTNPIGANPGDVWRFNASDAVNIAHYAMWPEKLVERMIKCSTKPKDIVLDPFCGSATTLAVADRLGREARGIDLGYEEIQRERMRGLQKELVEVKCGRE